MRFDVLLLVIGMESAKDGGKDPIGGDVASPLAQPDLSDLASPLPLPSPVEGLPSILGNDLPLGGEGSGDF